MRKVLLLSISLFTASSLMAYEYHEDYHYVTGAHVSDLTLVDGIYYILDDEHQSAIVSQGGYYDDLGGGTMEHWTNNTYHGDVIIPATVTHGGKTYTVRSIGNSAFSEWYDDEDKQKVSYAPLTSVKLPSTLVRLGDGAFSLCQELKAIDIPEGVKLIDDCFYGCTGLTELTIPASVDSFNVYSMSGCDNLRKLTFKDGETDLRLNGQHTYNGYYPIDPNIEELYLGRQTTGNYITVAYSSLKALTIGKYVREIASLQFIGNEGVTTLTFASPSRLKTIGKAAFNNMKALVTVTLPDGLETLGEDAFSYCENLATIDLGPTLKVIGNSAFSYTGLTELTIPASVEQIDDWAFYQAEKLTKLTIVDSEQPLKLGNAYSYAWDFPFGLFSSSNTPNLKEVYVGRTFDGGNAVFARCEQLSKATIGPGVTALNDGEFYDCKALASVTSQALMPPTCNAEGSPFMNVDTQTCHLYVPGSSIDAYKAAPVWKDFFNISDGIRIVQSDSNGTALLHTLDGRHVSGHPTAKGVYIVGGHKVIVK